jgi:hypothetical protein
VVFFDTVVGLIDPRGGKIMNKVLLVFAIVLTTVLLAWSQTSNDQANKSQVEGTWEVVSARWPPAPPKGERVIKMISGGHFVVVRYETEKGKPIYVGGGTYTLNGTSYTEHIDFMSESMSAGIIGKDQHFTVKVEGDTLTQKGFLSGGVRVEETYKRVN